jgi:Peptidase propeptide and YPEB domain
MTITTRILVSAFITAAILSAPAARASTEAVDPALQEKLTTQLKAEGYEVRKIQMEDGMIEAYAVKNGEKFELFFDTNLKLVKKVN